jgi:undecaprenyl diphosphate synthase
MKPEILPKHIGIIMDGNGRWATEQKLPRLAGHKKGVERVDEITEFAANIGIKALTLYAFSDENWRRPEEEVGALMSLLRWYLKSERAKILKNNIQFRVIGDKQKLSNDILKAVSQLEQDSAKNSGMHLCIGLSYGSRGEILRAVKRISEKVSAGEVFLNDITEELFEESLDTSGIPPLDMLVRTSGEFRLSNFMLWQAAYAELFFENTLWPDFTKLHLENLISEFALRDRRFGKTPEQVKEESKKFTPSKFFTKTSLRSV